MNRIKNQELRIKVVGGLIAILLYSLFLPLNSSVFAHSASVTIQMIQDGFVPREISLDTNSTVVFENIDSQDHWPASDIHPTHTIYPEFDPKKPISPGSFWTFKPQRSGRFTFHDHLNPTNKGVLRVSGEIEEDLSDEGQSIIRPYEQDLAENIDRILPQKRFRLKDKTENTNSYIREQMDICYKTGGRDSCYQDLAYILTYQFSLRDILDLIQKNEQNVEVFSRCHELTHFLTRLAFKKEKSIPKIYEQCTSVCHGGCYHGGIEEYLSEKQQLSSSKKLLSNENGFDKVISEIPKLCGQRSDYQIPLLYDECLHGIGHGTMYVTDGDLPRALNMCDNLPQQWERETCYSGAFMENSSSSTNLDHPSKFIKVDDPMYPCNILDKKYLNICYRYQSSHFAIISGSNWTETAKLCLQVPKEYQMPCFLTIGSNQVGASQDLEKIKSNCNLMSEDQLKNFCFQGAVDALAIRYRDDPSWGFNFCQKLDVNYQKDCLSQYGRSISSWSADTKNLEQLCNRLDNSQFAAWCRGEKSYVIKMTKNGFEPNNISIEENTLLQFKNEDDKDRWPASDLHPTHALYPEFDPKRPIRMGEVWEFTFKRAGTFNYHDHLSPHIRGSIVVTGPEDISRDSVIGRIKNFWQNFWSNFINSFQKALDSYKKLLPNSKAQVDQSILEQDQLNKIADLEGVEAAWKYLINTYQNDPGDKGRIHDLAHFLGGLIFEKLGFDGLSKCSPNFAFGCYHGFLDKAFSESLDQLNEAEKGCLKVGQASSGPYASCIHGIGHGVASFYRTSDFNNSLKACDRLKDGAQYCYDGVFMEFSRNAPPSFYKADNPLYPCDSVEQKFVFSCGRNLPTVLVARFNKSFDNVVNICGEAQNQDLKNSCFDALGFNAVARSQNKPDIIIDLCGKIESQEFKTRCIKAAAGELIFQNMPSWKDNAPIICNTLSGNDKNSCLGYLQQITRDYQR